MLSQRAFDVSKSAMRLLMPETRSSPVQEISSLVYAVLSRLNFESDGEREVWLLGGLGETHVTLCLYGTIDPEELELLWQYFLIT